MKQKLQNFRKILFIWIIVSFLTITLVPNGYVQTSSSALLNLPAPGTMVKGGEHFQPVMIHGLTVNPEDPLAFDFIISTGDTDLQGDALKAESEKLIKYFMAALTIPESEMWVNLSPHEKNRIIPPDFGDTLMGRDLLAQDYLLKQITATAMYPGEELGEEFWGRMHEKISSEHEIMDIPVDTFHKIWIVPETASVYEDGPTAFILDSRLKVMLEEDYLSMQHNVGAGLVPAQEKMATTRVTPTTSIIREIILPEIEREVNEGRTFANLRQIYHAMILSSWYKIKLQNSLLGQIYVDKGKTLGVDTEDKQINQKIYDQYLTAFKTGVYDFIQEEYNPTTQEIIPRRYFSGGAWMGKLKNIVLTGIILFAAAGTAIAESRFVERIKGNVYTLSIKTIESSPKNQKTIKDVATTLKVLEKSNSFPELEWPGTPEEFEKIRDEIMKEISLTNTAVFSYDTVTIQGKPVNRISHIGIVPEGTEKLNLLLTFEAVMKEFDKADELSFTSNYLFPSSKKIDPVTGITTKETTWSNEKSKPLQADKNLTPPSSPEEIINDIYDGNFEQALNKIKLANFRITPYLHKHPVAFYSLFNYNFNSFMSIIIEKRGVYDVALTFVGLSGNLSGIEPYVVKAFQYFKDTLSEEKLLTMTAYIAGQSQLFTNKNHFISDLENAGISWIDGVPEMKIKRQAKNTNEHLRVEDWLDNKLKEGLEVETDIDRINMEITLTLVKKDKETSENNIETTYEEKTSSPTKKTKTFITRKGRLDATRLKYYSKFFAIFIDISSSAPGLPIEYIEYTLNVILKEMWEEDSKGNPSFPKYIVTADESLLTAAPVGGINLDSSLLSLQIKRNERGTALPVSQQSIADINIEGLVPIVTRMRLIKPSGILEAFPSFSAN